MQRMNAMSRLAAGAVALVAAIALGAGAYAMWGDDDGGTTPASDTATEQGGGVGLGMCAPGYEDCIDTVVEDAGGAAGACLEGATDCADNPADGDAARCAADGPDCMEPLFADPECADDGTGDLKCETVCHGGDMVELVDPPANGPTLTDEEAERRDEQQPVEPAPEDCAPATNCDPASGDECLPPDCSVSSDGAIACSEPADAGNGGSAGGSGSAPAEPGEVAPAEPGVDPAQ